MSIAEPLFDSPAKALRFALNHHLALPRPQMNKMVADGKVQRIELADGTKITFAAPKGPPRNAQLRGLDGAATAGMILLELSRLPETQQLVLMASSVPAELSCSCRRPCCSGFMPNPEWVRPVLRICEFLRDEAVLSKIPGKKGMSTIPALRQRLVEKFFLPHRKISIEALAEQNHLARSTVHAHMAMINASLEGQLDLAWPTIDLYLQEAGIVGLIL